MLRVASSTTACCSKRRFKSSRQLSRMHLNIRGSMHSHVCTDPLTFHCMRCICHTDIAAATAEGISSRPPFSALMLRAIAVYWFCAKCWIAVDT